MQCLTIFEQQAAITPKLYEIGYQLLSHTGFRLIPKSMTLNDLERRNSSYSAFFSLNLIALPTNYVTVVIIIIIIIILFFIFLYPQV